ncbi:MAG: vWA domain-containing protein [Agrococcus casei]|nr:hypothetical protein [Agrococcus casei]
MGVGTLMWWWWIPLVILVVVAATVGGFLVYRRGRHGGGLPVAHVDRLTKLKAYRSAMRRYRWLTAAALVLVLVGGGVTSVIAARPAAVDAQQNEDYKRDILLCLDVSGSMVGVDAEIMRVFQNIVKGLNGERIGLRVFDASGYMAFPMTSDYEYIMDQLGLYERAFDGTLGPDEDFDYQAGTSSVSGASLVGDGLAGCANDFGDLSDDNDRPRSIILATDNIVNGNQIYSLEQAGQLAVDNEVRVYAINPFDYPLDTASQQLQTVAEGTGGEYYPMDLGSTVSGIIDNINSIEAGYIQTPPEVQVVDQPGNRPLLLVIVVGVLLVVAWRARI